MNLIASLLIVVTVGYLVAMAILSVRRPRNAPHGAPGNTFFVFVVPALNEERVIANTIDSLLALPDDRTAILVIDDGSSDRTAEIVQSYPDPRVQLLQRTAPNARQGKGAALNAAYRDITRRIGPLDPARVIVAVIDADGRLDPDALDHVAPHFAQSEVGGLQLMVRIRNRERWLTRFQDFEFVSFSTLVQRARQHLGSVGLGGNGQFVRLSALHAVGPEPWSDCLTEDLDLGLRLAMAGWDNHFTAATSVEQQGVLAPRALWRQRTRWLHGHWQCWRLIPDLLRSNLPSRTVADLCYYLAAPAVLLAASILFTIPLIGLGVAITTGRWFTGLSITSIGNVALWYVLAFAPAILLAVAYRRHARDVSLMRALAIGHLLVVYNYIWYLSAWRALGRIIMRRANWTKTARHLESEPDDMTLVASLR